MTDDWKLTPVPEDLEQRMLRESYEIKGIEGTVTFTNGDVYDMRKVGWR